MQKGALGIFLEVFQNGEMLKNAKMVYGQKVVHKHDSNFVGRPCVFFYFQPLLV